jgi:hypothetical protein
LVVDFALLSNRLALLISTRLQPGVKRDARALSRFNGFTAEEKPSKRFFPLAARDTGLKPGANERKALLILPIV